MDTPLEVVTELPELDCWELLREQEFGRLAFHLANEVHIVPINYLVDGQNLVFRTAEGSKLLGVTMNQDVAFEVDRYDEKRAVSVVVRGKARELEGAEADRAEQLPSTPGCPTTSSAWSSSSRPRSPAGRSSSRGHGRPSASSVSPGSAGDLRGGEPREFELLALLDHLAELPLSSSTRAWSVAASTIARCSRSSRSESRRAASRCGPSPCGPRGAPPPRQPKQRPGPQRLPPVAHLPPCAGDRGRPLLLGVPELEVLLHASGQLAHPAIPHEGHLTVADPLEEVPVV